jgi:hypothetical protein
VEKNPFHLVTAPGCPLYANCTQLVQSTTDARSRRSPPEKKWSHAKKKTVQNICVRRRNINALNTNAAVVRAQYELSADRCRRRSTARTFSNR